MHTNVGSACGRNSGAEMAAACRECGYSGAFITDHNWGGNTAIDRSLPWREWMTGFAGMAARVCRDNACLPRDVYERHLDALKTLMAKGVGSGGTRQNQDYNLGGLLP